MDYQALREKYKIAALQFAQDWRTDVTPHNVDTMISIMFQRDGIMDGGGFVNSVCDNDLVGAVSRADHDNIRVIKLLALTYINCHI